MMKSAHVRFAHSPHPSRTAPKLKAGISLDYELDSTVSLNITATDAGGLSLSKGFTVNVTNVNEVPIVATLIPDYYTTLNTAQTFSIASSFADPDAGTTLTYS